MSEEGLHNCVGGYTDGEYTQGVENLNVISNLLPVAFWPNQNLLGHGPPIVQLDQPADIESSAEPDLRIVDNRSIAKEPSSKPAVDLLTTSNRTGVPEGLRGDDSERANLDFPESVTDEADTEDVETSFRVQGYKFDIPKPGYGRCEPLNMASAMLQNGVHVYYRRTTYMLDVKEQMLRELQVINAFVDAYNTDSQHLSPVHIIDVW